MTSPTQKLLAEGLGTAVLIVAVIGSGIMAQTLTQDIALVLLANTIATGATLLVLITIFEPLSGAHFNPAVTLVMVLRSHFGWQLALAYVGAQIIGGALGVLIAHSMFELPLLQFSTHIRTGSAQWFAEGVASFGLVLTIFGALHARQASVPLMVSAYIMAAYWFTASTSFANPAVTIARTLSDTFAGIRPSDAPGFILAQFAGALLALALSNYLFKAHD